MAKISHGEVLTDVGLRGGNHVEGIRDHEDVVDAYKENADAIEGMRH
jgi:cobalamin synthase